MNAVLAPCWALRRRRRAGLLALGVAVVCGCGAHALTGGFSTAFALASVGGADDGDSSDAGGGYGTAAVAVALALWYGTALRQGQALSAEEAQEPQRAGSGESVKKPRIDAFDSLRFFLIFYIASGHFIQTATSNGFVLKLISQINVVVGAFFVLSGYVAAYTTTELGQLKGSSRLDNALPFAVDRIMSFWPLHMLVLVIFSPMFMWVDVTYSGWPTALWNSFLSTQLLQAWFPLSAEIWNAPTWFLSAYSFCLLVLPFCLRVLAVQNKHSLRKILVFLTLLELVPRLSYTYDLGAWTIMEGTLNAKTHPNYALFNAVRFSPMSALLEVLMGVVACRLVMLDGHRPAERSGSSVPILLALKGLCILRALGVVQVNDMLTRSLAFIPLWLVFLMRIHRESTGPGGLKALPKYLCHPVLQYLGSISFPTFVVHGPIGQLLFKKAVARKVWGGVLSTPLPNGVHWFFGVYWLAVIISASLLNRYFLASKSVGAIGKTLSAKICKFWS